MYATAPKKVVLLFSPLSPEMHGADKQKVKPRSRVTGRNIDKKEKSQTGGNPI